MSEADVLYVEDLAYRYGKTCLLYTSDAADD